MGSYQISEEEAATGLHVYKIIQARWNSKVVAPAASKLRHMRKKAIKEKWSLAKLQEEVDAYIGKLREEYPEEFPEIGWWDKQQAGVLMKESKIKGREAFEVCKLCNIRLPAMGNAGAFEVDGELWIVHRRCINRKKREEKATEEL